ncbi:MAG TPA: protein-L-isoaspartate(D-aspartate) O-methyltransferase [Myxococcota bacterium]|nr:protein-L-isoaspartate(D-aspartate) O-methyltransferase [Myxococcota bacterium]
MDDESASARRARMVEQQLAARGIADARVLAAMRALPRHVFVSPDQAELAYQDRALPLGEGQTLSQPFVVALMLEAARLAGPERVLEVGAGSGYVAALLSRLAREVYAIELDPELAERARRRLAELGCANVELRAGDGARGWPERAPFDAILVSAAMERLPEALAAQLAVGGRLVAPLGTPRGDQSLVRLTKTGGDSLAREELCVVQFVPLVAPRPASR